MGTVACVANRSRLPLVYFGGLGVEREGRERVICAQQHNQGDDALHACGSSHLTFLHKPSPFDVHDCGYSHLTCLRKTHSHFDFDLNRNNCDA